MLDTKRLTNNITQEMIYLFSNLGDSYIEHFFLIDGNVLFDTTYSNNDMKSYMMFDTVLNECVNAPEFEYELPGVLTTYKDLSLDEFKLKVEQRKEEIILSKL